MKMTKVVFAIRGVSPLMMHNAASMPDRDPSDVTTARAKKRTEEEQVKASLYLSSSGGLYVPSAAFRSAILTACKGRKIGKIGAATVISGAVMTVSDEVPLINPKTIKPITEKDVVVDKRSAVNHNCNPPARIIAVRPKFMHWSCNLELEVDESLVAVKVVEEILSIAGKIVGIGPFRVEKKGTFGRFEAEIK